MTFPFFVFSLIFAIEIHPFFSDVSMTFVCFFRGLCAFLCAFGVFTHLRTTRFALKSCKKALKTYVFKAFSWSEWRDSNSRPHGPEWPPKDLSNNFRLFSAVFNCFLFLFATFASRIFQLFRERLWNVLWSSSKMTAHVFTKSSNT